MKLNLIIIFFLFSSNVFAQTLDGDISKLQYLNRNSNDDDRAELQTLLNRLIAKSNMDSGGNVSGGGGNVSGGSNKRVIYNGNDVDKNFIKNYQISQLGLPKLHQSGFDGRKFRVAIVDSGINPRSAAANKVVYFKDFTSECSEPMCDLSGHGTLVADLVTQAAPSASLVVLKILSQDIKGDFAKLFQALKWILKNHKKMNIKVVNLSLMTPDRVFGYYNEVDEARELIKELASEGVLLVTAVGNDYKKKNFDLFPASAVQVLSVGSYDHKFSENTYDRELSPFSNYGIANQPTVQHSTFLWSSTTHKDFNRWSFKPEVLAPGENLLACSEVCEFVSGTSYSAGLVTGGILSLLDKDPEMSLEKFIKLQKQECLLPILKFDSNGMFGRFEVCATVLE